MRKDFSLIIPTYNEKDNIEPLVNQLHKVLSGYDYEIVFIDDNSQDGTAESIREMESRFPVRVVVRKDEKGLASAVVDGIGYADSDIVGVMDADLQHPPEVVPYLFRALEEGADIAIASRYVKGGGCVGWGFTRKVVSRVAILISQLFLPETRTVHDPMSGCFMFRKQVVQGVELAPTGFKILLEILVKGKQGELVEVPYLFRSRQKGESKLGVKQQIDYLKHIYNLMSRSREFFRFCKFCLVGGSGVLVNMGLLWVFTEFVGLYYLLSAVISIETSIISNFTLNSFFTFSDRPSHDLQTFLKRLLKFNAVSLGGLVINITVLWFFSSIVGIYYLISNLFGIAVAILWNYFVNVLWTWR